MINMLNEIILFIIIGKPVPTGVNPRKGNLKAPGGQTQQQLNGPRRVSFDPLALLLDASLEGELELVRATAGRVADASAANDEGITALHNAICAGHLGIVRFLVQFGCDVNAQDSDGWYVSEEVIYFDHCYCF